MAILQNDRQLYGQAVWRENTHACNAHRQRRLVEMLIQHAYQAITP